MERPDLFRELIGGGFDNFQSMSDVGARPLHSDPMHSFFGPSPSAPSFLSSPSPMSLSPSPLLYEQMQRMTAESHFGSMKHDRFTFQPPSFPPSTFPPSTSTLNSTLPSSSSSPSFDLKTLQTHAQESEELQRNLEYHVQMNQLKHLHKLLNFQASMSYIQAMKIAAAADQTQALLNTLDLAIRSNGAGSGGSPAKKFPRSTLVQDHILNVSKQLELISQHPMMSTGSLSFGGPLSTNPFLGDGDPFAHHAFPLPPMSGSTRTKLEQDIKKLREVSGLPLHPSDQSLEQQLQQQHTQQLLLEQRQKQQQDLVKTPSSPHPDQPSTSSLIPSTPSNGPSPFRGSLNSLPLSREYLKTKDEPTQALTPTTPLTPMLGSPPVSPSSLSSLSHSDPPTPTPEEKYHQKRRSELIADNNKQQKGEKGLFYCEDPACGAELRTRSGFRRHRQKHASGHVLRKRARKSPSGDLDLPLKSLATPATVVSQRHPLAQSLHNLTRPPLVSNPSATHFDPFPPTTDLLF